MSFKNKVVIVTGGGSGIGAAIAKEFAKEGAHVAITGRREEKLVETARECALVGKEILVIRADVTKEEDAERIIQTTVETFGKLDVLVNNAGVGRAGSILKADLLQAYDEVMNTNLRSAVHLTTLAATYLIKTKGNVINISSVRAWKTPTVPELFVYSISKAALNQFTKCAAIELASEGVRVNSVCPGPVRTDILTASNRQCDWDYIKRKTALQRVSEPEEIADIVLFIASDKAKSITGSDYVSDNGMLLNSEV